MTSLYVDRRGVVLKADGEALAFYEEGQRVGTVPLAPLSRVFLRGDVTLSSSLLGKFGERGIGVVILSGRKGVPSMLLGRPHNDASRRLGQYGLARDPDACLRFAREVVRQKLASQASFLSEKRDALAQSRYALTLVLRKIDGALASLDRHTTIAALRGAEGAGAAAYFDGIAELVPDRLGFKRRNRRPPRDPVNAVLSLGYTLLHAEAVIALYGAGLDPFIGFYHALDFARESLACDIVESLRVEVDRHAIRMFNEETLRAEDFSQTAEGCMMGKAGRARFYEAWERAAERIRKGLTERVADVVTAVCAIDAKLPVASEQLS